MSEIGGAASLDSDTVNDLVAHLCYIQYMQRLSRRKARQPTRDLLSANMQAGASVKTDLVQLVRDRASDFIGRQYYMVGRSY